MIYLDNAATSLIKPPAVYKANDEILQNFCANAGRSGHKTSLKAAELIYTARCVLADFFGLQSPENLIFTFGCTDSLNTVIRGVLQPGDHVLTTVFEHNAVLRPLYGLKKDGVDFTVVPPHPNGLYDPAVLSPYIQKNTRALIVNYVSNVTGSVQNMKALGAFCKENKLLFIVDAAQAAGHFNVNAKEMMADYVCCAGHKGLLGPQGIGIIAIGSDAPLPRPLRLGGTGSRSAEPEQPKEMPEYLESGTLPVHTIAALAQGVLFVKDHFCTIRSREEALTLRLFEGLKQNNKITVYGAQTPQSGVLLCNMAGKDAAWVSNQLDARYGICVRSGLHCAPLAHRFLGTEKTGAVRFSVGFYNTNDEIDQAVEAMKALVKQ